MSGKPRFEETPVERLKIQHRSFMRAVHESLKAWPTAAADIFRCLDMNPMLSITQFSPSDYEHGPSLLSTLEVIEYMGPGARRVAAEIADMTGCVTVPTANHRKSTASMDDALGLLGKKMGKVMAAINDLPAKPTMTERIEARETLQAMIDAAHLAMIKLSSGAPRNAQRPAPHAPEQCEHPEGGAPASSVAQGYKEPRLMGR